MEEYPFTFRDPIHGFIGFNALEWDLINSKPFQRLRRIRQLAWTDMVYPSAMHTRFAHSLGVCHIASRLYDAIVQRDKDLLRSEYHFTDSGVHRQRQIIRLAALMHDLGHGPFSHAAEELFPFKEEGKRWVHEDYSAAIALQELRELVENHNLNKNNYGIKIDEIADIFSPASKMSSSIVWKEIISGQMDADRMDYLLRDAYHAGVSYGKYDLDRVINTICLCEDEEVGGHLVGVEDDGIHAAEGLLIARYMMFTQVYFHKTRVIYDYHYEQALLQILSQSGGTFPEPTMSLHEYLCWDDWQVLAELKAGNGGDHGRRLMDRDHFRMVFYTSEVPDANEMDRFETACTALSTHNFVVRDASKSWYKFRRDEIRVRLRGPGRTRSVPLATRSPIVNGLRTVNQRRLYVNVIDRLDATRALRDARL